MSEREAVIIKCYDTTVHSLLPSYDEVGVNTSSDKVSEKSNMAKIKGDRVGGRASE